MFCFLVTRGTESNQVGQRVGLLVILVLAGYIAEGAKGLDMVNVKESFALLVFASTAAACVIVALTRSAPLRTPVGAIVFLVTTLPSWVACPCLIPREPFATTIQIAKKVSGFLYTMFCHVHGLTTLGTSNNHTIPEWAIAPPDTLPVTFLRTEPGLAFSAFPYVKCFSACFTSNGDAGASEQSSTFGRAAFPSPDFTFINLKDFVANRTFDIYRIVIVRPLAFQGRAIAARRAIKAVRSASGNEVLAAMLASALVFLLRGIKLASATAKSSLANIVSLVSLAAIFAFKDVFFAHKKSPVGIDRQLVEGARIPTGDLVNTISFRPAGQTFRAFDSFIVPERAL